MGWCKVKHDLGKPHSNVAMQSIWNWKLYVSDHKLIMRVTNGENSVFQLYPDQNSASKWQIDWFQFQWHQHLQCPHLEWKKKNRKEFTINFCFICLKSLMFIENLAKVRNTVCVRNHVKLMRVINSRRAFSKGTVLCGGY